MSDEKKQENLKAENERLREALRIICNKAADEQIRIDSTLQTITFATEINFMAHRALLGTWPKYDQQDHPVSFALKLCEPLPQVDESTFKPREWSISKEELEDGKR